MPDDDPLAEYEAQFADVVDPSGFNAVHGDGHNGARVVELMTEATDLAVADMVRALNEGKVACSQYLLSTGLSIIAMCSKDGRTVRFVVQVPANEPPFITHSPKEGTEL